MPTDKDCIIKSRRIGKPRWYFLVDADKEVWTADRSRAKRLNIVDATKAMQKFREQPHTEIKIEIANLHQERD